MEAHTIEKRNTSVVKRDLISLNTKNGHWLRKTSRGEVGSSWSFKEGDVPWIFKKDDLSVAKVVILDVKETSLYG